MEELLLQQLKIYSKCYIIPLVMKKKLLLILALLVIILIGLGIYLNKTLILNKIKTEALKTIETQTGRAVSFDKVEYAILKGFVISNLEVSEKSAEEKTPFLKAKEISFNPVLFPFILNKQIMIPSITIDSLSVNIVRLDKDVWNFSDLIKTVSERPKSEFKFSVSVLSIKFTDSELFFQDKTQSPTFSKKLNNLNITLKPSLPKSLKFDLETIIDDEDGQISIAGKIVLPTKEIKSSINFKDLLITDYLPYLDKLPLTVKDGKLSADLNCNFKNDALNLEGTTSFEDLDIQKNKIKLIADASADFKFVSNPKNIDKPFDYKAEIDLSGAKIIGLKYIKEIDDVNGKINISPDKISSKEINGQFSNEPFTLSGRLENFKEPYLDLKINTSPSFLKLKEIFEEKINIKTTDIDGNSNIKLSIKGSLKEPKSLQIRGKTQISDVRFKADYLPKEISNVNAEVAFDKNKISWSNLTGKFGTETLTSHGSLTDFENPKVKLNLSSDTLNFDAALNIQDKLMKITKLQGSYLNSQLNIIGDVDISTKGNPLFNLQSTVKIDLKDLSNLNPKLNEKLKNYKLSGLIETRAKLNGGFKNYQNLYLELNGNSSVLSIFGLNINNIKFDCIKRDSLADMQITGVPYSGKLLIKIQADFLEKDIPFVSNIIINDVDVSQLKNDTGLKDKDISGLLQAAANLKGSSGDIKSSLNGAGQLMFEDGNLWQLELFKGIGQLLVIPEFQKIVFKKASGDFIIGNSRIATDNFMLESEKVNFLFEGNLDFSNNIDFEVTTQLAEGLIEDATDLKGILSSVLAQSTNAVTIKLTGTLQKPQYRIIPIPAKIFKKSKEFIFEDVVGGVLEDILK